MTYRRLGSGPPLLVLGAVEEADVERLAARHRVIVPELPAPDEDVRAWLTGFLEGLGTTGLTVLAAKPFYAAARDVAAADPDRLTQVLSAA